MIDLQPDERLLEQLLLPLTENDKALEFLRRVVPNVLTTLHSDLLRASETEEERRLHRLQDLRERVRQAATMDNLLALADPLLLPSRLFDPESVLWDSWSFPALREELAQAVQQHQKAQELLKATQPGTLTYLQVKKRAEEADNRLLDAARQTALAWLEEKEQEIRQGRAGMTDVEWQVETRLQVPLVVGDHLVDYVDAEITLTLTTPQAFLTRTFAVVVIPPDVGIIPALRRINLLRHYLPSEVEIIAITTNPHHLRALQQHGTHVYLVSEKNLDPKHPSDQ